MQAATAIDGRAETSCTEEESAFGIEELFFSHTDERGILRSGNEVFRRVSEYGWDELIGAPHKIVRHDDMPKAVFWVLWDRLRKGLLTGAYVKNRARSGKFYWVFAIVFPVPGGYSSIRLKPTSPMLAAVQALYGDLRAGEKSGEFDTDQSVMQLMGGLADLGFRDYNAFMARALVDEMEARDRALGHEQTLSSDNLRTLLDTAAGTLKYATRTMALFQQIRGFPINLQIQAMKRHATGKLFGVIAADYRRFCSEIEVRLKAFMETSLRVSDRVSTGIFMLCTSEIQAGMIDYFRAEQADADSGIDTVAEIQRLEDQAGSYAELTLKGLIDIMHEAEHFESVIAEITWLVGALNMTRTIGNIETARMGAEGITLQKMMEEAESFQRKIVEHLEEIDEQAGEVGSGAETFWRYLKQRNEARALRPAG